MPIHATSSMRITTTPSLFTVVTVRTASESWSGLSRLRVAGTETCGAPVLKVAATHLRITQPEQWVVRPHPSGRWE